MRILPPAPAGGSPARAPGLLVALAVAAVATVAGHEVPVVGGPVFGIVLGLLTAALATRVVGAGPFDRSAARAVLRVEPVLQASIVLLGATLSLEQVAVVGLSSLPVMLGTLTVALVGAWLLGRLLDVRGDTQLLIGVGTAICGASAIAATQAVIRAKESQVAYAVATIFTFNIAAVLLFPQLGHLLHLDPRAFGLWAGTAINDTSSVGSRRLQLRRRRRALLRRGQADPQPHAHPDRARPQHLGGTSKPCGSSQHPAHPSSGPRRLPSWTKIVPLFLLGFIAASALDTLGVIPIAWHSGLTTAGTFLITTALAGIGLALRPADLRRAGMRPLLLGAVLWILVAASSLALQALTGTL